MVQKSRITNVYCAPVYPGSESITEKYSAINNECYRRTKTIEIRMHHGSVNANEITNWVNFLLSIINYRGRLGFGETNFKTVQDKLKLKGKTLTYLKIIVHNEKKYH